jgi:CRISPR-associated endonuclease/helicase Cas3
MPFMGNAPVRDDGANSWRSAETFAVLAAIAALFHDFGKAGRCFQQSLAGTGKFRFQPYRHEWISLRLFEAFAGQKSDDEWLAKLGQLSSADEKPLLAKLVKDHPDRRICPVSGQALNASPLRSLAPLARAVGWLILSHHRLPQARTGEPDIAYCRQWLENQLNPDWNSLNHKKFKTRKIFEIVWTFPQGTPLRSRTWRHKAQQVSRQAMKLQALRGAGEQGCLFTQHMARLTLMLADHHYSAQPAAPAWRDENYVVWANGAKSGVLQTMNQRLDEHLCGVAHYSMLIGRMLPRAMAMLPAIGEQPGFCERIVDKRYRWQNSAWDVAFALRARSRRHGFFGINMASTGCGKTFANARIMSALSDTHRGCRFSVALGLRTLTLQTASMLEKRLGLSHDLLAVLTGSTAARELHDPPLSEPDDGSDSAGAMLEESDDVHFAGVVCAGPLGEWLNKDPRVARMVCAPVLVTTIDHLMPAVEGVSGGRQIPAMLRLLSSDLVLDEPDDFDPADLHAQCRLVHWAGMLGARVLLSSATLPPAQVETLFSAYCEGRRAWQRECGEAGVSLNICCAWFDEYGSTARDAASDETFSMAHREFALLRASRLSEQKRLRLGNIVPVRAAAAGRRGAIDAVAAEVQRQMLRLDADHHDRHQSGKTVSLGIVLLANIDPLVAVAQTLMAQASPDGCCIHYSIYHSQHPLAVRSFIEKRLDRAFDRRDPAQLWQLPEVSAALSDSLARRHLFVVLATSVVEVGRDWDAHWGIIEPSSMRSLIQFAGRIQRHRAIAPASPNLIILGRNINALSGRNPAYCQPGYETLKWSLPSHDMQDLLPEAACRGINALARIAENNDDNAFAALEHRRLRAELLGQEEMKAPAAALWWRAPVTWCAELQRRRPFRCTGPQAQFFIRMSNNDDIPAFFFKTETGNWKASERFIRCKLTMGEGVKPWFRIDYNVVLTALAVERKMTLTAVSERYGEVTLRVHKRSSADPWWFHPLLGVFRTPD